MFQWLLVILSLVILISNGTHSFNIINDTKTGLELHPPKTLTTNDEDFNATNSNYSNTNIINISARTTIKSDIKNCTQQQQQQHKQHKQNEGHEEEYHAEIRPCMFCNQSVSCDPDYLVCRENVCMLVDYEGNLFCCIKMLGGESLFEVDWTCITRSIMTHSQTLLLLLLVTKLCI